MNREVAVAEAIALVEGGLSANKAAEKVAPEAGVTPRTVKRWAQQAGQPLGQKTQDTAKNAREAAAEQHKAKREQLKVRMLDKALDLLGRMDDEHVDFKGKDAGKVTYPIAPADAVRNYAVSVGILVDKLRLESGEVTARTETISLGELDTIIAKMELEIDSHA